MKRYTKAWLEEVLVSLFMEAGASRDVRETTSDILIEGVEQRKGDTHYERRANKSGLYWHRHHGSTDGRKSC